MTTRIKICGITCREDAVAAVTAGADALGFVFYEPSSRYVDPAVAADIISTLPPFITSVGLFVDAPQEQVQRVIDLAGLDLLQFHGDETEQQCSRFSRPYIKALRVRPGLDVESAAAVYRSARGLLLDAYRPGVPGGTGEVFDWALIPRTLAGDITLAGGLTPANVAAAITQVQPYAVDVSGGVEAAPGRKDKTKMCAFAAAVRALS
ncbi:phosphoribosylanthranilate isomerase [Marinobacterium sp. MBR-109]|jgi:phosphoribosylanthranilate isomerase|uniref:phosphoribosylanthranilate isomerase n=1 Tax=Marinobacterium sp. MBR-109 TaxID=3156462 RepID=UPI003395B3CC